jgi:hypothetical protein
MSQDINALEIAQNVKPRTVGAFMTSPSNQDCFNAADCIIAQADRIEALERQLAEVRPASEWQPIETAPKDGRKMIFLLGPSGFPQVAYSNTWWTSGFSFENRPTHWMPIPSAPSAGQAKPDILAEVKA